MSERARALEQALRMLIDAAVQTACKIAEDGDRRWHVVDLVCATNDAEKLLAVDPLRALAYDIGTVRDVAARRGDPDVDHRLMLVRLDHWRSVILSAIASLEAVDPPPSGASPQAEELRAANVANLREMVGMAGRHRETLLAVRECILALSPGHRTGYDWNADPLFLTLKEGRALNLIDDALKATPASPQAETSDDLSELWRQELYPHVEPDTFKRFLCDLTAEGWDDVRKEVFALQSIVDSRPAPVSPVEPTCREIDAIDEDYEMACRTNQALSARLAAVEAERDKAQRALATAYLKARRQASVCEPNEDQFAGAMAVVAAAFPNTRVEATAVRIAKPEEPTELVVAVKRRAERAEAERDRLKADQQDWRKGVALIASALGDKADDLSCVRIAEVALTLRATLEEAHALLKLFQTCYPAAIASLPENGMERMSAALTPQGQSTDGETR